MYLQRIELKALAESVGLGVSLYPLEVDDKVGVGCDILEKDQLIHQLSTLQFDETSSIEEASQHLSLLVAHASIVINDYGTPLPQKKRGQAT